MVTESGQSLKGEGDSLGVEGVGEVDMVDASDSNGSLSWVWNMELCGVDRGWSRAGSLA